jgi:alginate O-acetyltransferase complex protein AlgI
LFLAVFACLIRFVNQKSREWVLLLGSLAFYAAWDVRFVFLLVGLGAYTFYWGQRFAQRNKNFRELLLAIGGILAVLGYFKYTGMLVELFNSFAGPTGRVSIPSIVLPLGLSFYTFECISYLLDIFKGGQPLLPFRRFLLFPSFWPHMVAGPILRIKEFAPQLESYKVATWHDVTAGIDRIIIGLVKKLALANSLATIVDHGFGNGARANSAVDNWVLAFAFGLQIYLDFSSYSDIAIGSARVLGFTFPENFELPYHAASPSDFWNRWHMTLSRWIRDYVFFPLNLKFGARKNMRYVTLIGAMALVGLWHGAGLTFILWGVWHGVLMTLHRLIQPWTKPRVTRSVALKAVGHAVTVLSIMAGWIWFRASTVAQAGRMLASMFLMRGIKPALSFNDYLLVLFCAVEYLAIEPVFRKMIRHAPSPTSTFGWLRPVSYVLAFELVFMFDQSNVAFIYFQF